MELIKNKERLRKATAYPFFRTIIKWACIVLGVLATFYAFWAMMVFFSTGEIMMGALIISLPPALSLLVYAVLSMYCDIADAALLGMRGGPSGRNPKFKKDQPGRQNGGRNRGRRRGPRPDGDQPHAKSD